MGQKTMNGLALAGLCPLDCTVVSSWEPASSDPPAEAWVKVLLCTHLSDLERYTLDWCVGGDSFRIETSL